jgi:uncharacterized protein YbjT (DUF2867 family)
MNGPDPSPAPLRRHKTRGGVSDRTALVLGATGLVGGHCLELLLADPLWEQVRVLGRRPLGIEHAKLDEHLVDFDRLGSSAELFEVDAVFCCLGTTIREAGSRDAFRRVDYQYPVEAAQLAVSRGAQQYLLVSAIGADRGSRFFYNRVKGETERAVAQAGFASVVIARPSLLRGEREESRPGEQVGAVLLKLAAPLLLGPLAKYRAVHARDVARALVELAHGPADGVRIVESDELRALARAADT